MIDSFKGRYRFLSNFFIEPDGTCVEVEYQRAKCANPEQRSLFDGLTPGQAKRAGRKVALRSDWETVKYLLMHYLVEKKFKDHPDLMKLLQATRPDDLVEGNDWGDRYWGVCRGQGENHLGGDPDGGPRSNDNEKRLLTPTGKRFNLRVLSMKHIFQFAIGRPEATQPRVIGTARNDP